MRALPIGIQTFAKIRDDDFIYIDKTPLIFQLVQRPGAYFLSRPRRFGKSLLVDTFKELFEGNQALFSGLYIHDQWDWSKSYPVIKLDFASGVINSANMLNQTLINLIQENQQRLGIALEINPEDLNGTLIQLIQQAHRQTGLKVAILIDEYDKPILDNIDHPQQAVLIREALKNIYSVFKGQDRYIQFIFMTGVSKFSKVSLFSGLNQLQDITLDRRFATICGYTQQDLKNQFSEHLAGVDWKRLKDWYNGYQFLGEPVYNPFDVLLFIANGQAYRHYWFETGSPSFLLKLFQQKCYFLPSLEQIEVGEEILDSFDVENINPITLLFQTGYLTIDKVVPNILEEASYHLRIPNREVQMALHTHLLRRYSQLEESLQKHRTQLARALIQADFTDIQSEIQRLFAAIPWRNFTKNDLDAAEGYYASVLYAWLASMNAEIIPEDISNHGQADLTIKLAEQIYIIEIKLNKTQSYQQQRPNPALQQIIERGYARKYQGQAVHLIGLIFNQAARNLVQMDWLAADNQQG